MGSDDDIQPGFLTGIKQAFSRNRRSVSEEEIMELVDDNDELLEDEKRMIGEILSLNNLTAAEVMQPRVDIIAAQDDESIRNVLERMQGTGYSRLPVYREDLDTVVGIAHYKDLVPAILNGDGDEPIADYMNEVLFVPETKDLLPLLTELQNEHQQMAVVVDEYGGTDGLLTIEDIIEEIVGEIHDETDSDSPTITEISENQWQADGKSSVKDAIDLGLPVEESEGYETIAGWLIDTLGAVPKVGEEFEIRGFGFKVTNMRRRRIQTILITRIDSELSEGVTDSAQDDSE